MCQLSNLPNLLLVCGELAQNQHVDSLALPVLALGDKDCGKFAKVLQANCTLRHVSLHSVGSQESTVGGGALPSKGALSLVDSVCDTAWSFWSLPPSRLRGR